MTTHVTRLAAGAGAALLAFTASAAARLHAADDVRAAWIARTSLTSPQSIDDAIAGAKRGGFNTLLVQVRARGDAYYLNGIEPRPASLFSQPAFDPLADALAKGHAQGLRVYAWINVNLVAGTDVPNSRGHVAYRHPEWLMVPRRIADDLAPLDPDGPEFLGRLIRYARAQADTLEGLYLSPATTGAVNYTAGVVRDIVLRYAVDGVYFDYIRYPGDDLDYGRETLKAFGQNPAAAQDRWRKFRADRLNALLAALRGAVKTARPTAVVTASQEPWLAQGLLDAVLHRTPDPSPDSVKAASF
ncbi:MAG TPA: family 10 glycosylhydrolase [Vicinamibacterales bacterium]|nr:family 10 glycosylhydrolase [Vicinamibacterales bacterium]